MNILDSAVDMRYSLVYLHKKLDANDGQKKGIEDAPTGVSIAKVSHIKQGVGVKGVHDKLFVSGSTKIANRHGQVVDLF